MLKKNKIIKKQKDVNKVNIITSTIRKIKVLIPTFITKWFHKIIVATAWWKTAVTTSFIITNTWFTHGPISKTHRTITLSY